MWSWCPTQVGQVDAVFAQLTLLHMHVRYMVDPKFYRDEAEEEVRAWMLWCCVTE